jgi:hypothetical protein
MGAAAVNWIHDTSMDQRYVDLWNKASKPIRAGLLKEAGRDPYLKHRAWEGLDNDVRIDVSHIIDIQAAKKLAESRATPLPSKVFHTYNPTPSDEPWWKKYY